eukprot:TRINITY_DN113113_c0_g1_i1.p1 TRINITY_DN113113_c0_g1~~TRINITY_DN113113_c0_g1_i1.p1  ORF type:complete len:118 (-),score=14.98 TRINITY_DN113113_c0_g1_i1:85-438(-)
MGAGALMYGMFAEAVWLYIGGFVGGLGPLLGAIWQNYQCDFVSAHFGFFLLCFTALVCAAVSGLTAFAMQAVEGSVGVGPVAHRIAVCGGVNVAMFLFLFLYSAERTRKLKTVKQKA